MLELRPNCECCDRDLATDDPNVFICTIECTWCGNCARELGYTCPNCGGNLTHRPIRPEAWLSKYPASTARVFNPECLSRLSLI